MKVCCRWVPHQLTWQKQNDTHGVIPDGSSALWRAWWSIPKQNLYRRWHLGLALHLREQGWMNDVEASSISSQKEVQDCAISKESEYWYYLRWSSVGCFHTSEFKNKYSCLIGHSKETQGSCLARDTRVLTKVVLLCTMLNFIMLPQLWISWNLGTGKFFHIHRTVFRRTWQIDI